jgi:hypothetical protein
MKKFVCEEFMSIADGSITYNDTSKSFGRLKLPPVKNNPS